MKTTKTTILLILLGAISIDTPAPPSPNRITDKYKYSPTDNVESLIIPSLHIAQDETESYIEVRSGEKALGKYTYLSHLLID